MGQTKEGFFSNMLSISYAYLRVLLINIFAIFIEKKVVKKYMITTTIPKLIPLQEAYPDNNKFLTCKVLFMKEKFTSNIERTKLFSITLAMLIANMFFANNAIGQIAFRNAQSATTSTTTLTITKPTNLAVGDLMIANILQDGNDGSNFVDAVGNGATWTQIAGTNLLTSGNDRWRSTILYKVATAADVAATDFDFDLDAQSDDGAGGILAFSGVAVTGGVSSTPFDVTPGSALTNIANDNSLTATAVTTATSNAMIVMLGAAANDLTFSNWVATNPATLTEAIERLLNVALDASVGAAYGTRTGTGSTGTASAAISATTTNGALLVALRPCTANPTITTASTPQATAAVCFSGSPQNTTLAYTATTNSPTAYSIDWNAAANTAGLTDQNSTAFAFAGGGGTVTGITIPASVAAATYNGTMYVTTAAGCITSKTITLTINPAPTVNAGGALSAICQGGTSAALGGSVGGSATGGAWDDGGVGGTFNPSATTLNATWTPPGAYTGTAVLTLTTSGGSCGTTFASKNQVVNGSPTTAAAGSDNTFCIGGYTLGANTAVVGAGAWTIPSGPNTSTTQITGGLSNPTATFTPTAAGTYTLRWTISNSGCTSSFDEVVYTVNALPQVSAFTGNSICSGGIGTLTATLSGASPFTVTYNPGAIPEGGVTSGTPFNATPNPVSTSNYTITSILDANGCIRNSGFGDNAATITLNTDGTWTGAVNTDWFEPGNWCGGVPTATTDVIINSGGNQPTIGAVGAVCNDITINSGATLTMNSPGTLSVNGNWSKPGSFTGNVGTTVSFDGGTQTISNNATTFRNLTINSTVSTTISTSQNVAGALSVPSGNTLITSGGTFTLSGTGSTVSGTLRNTGATITSTAAGLTFNAAGTYDHAMNSGAIPSATWNAASNCNITGVTTTIPTTSTFAPASGFGNFTWNCTSQTDDESLAGSLVDVNGNFTVSNTGSGSLRLSNGGVNTTINIAGNLSQSQGEFYIGGTTSSNTWVVNIDGDLSITGGTFFNMAGNSGSTTINLKGDFTMSGGTLTESGTATNTFNFNGTSTQTFSKTAGTISNTIAFAIANGATVDFGTSILNGSNGTFNANNGSTLITANTAGISTSAGIGTVQVTGTKTYNAGANYRYNGAAVQATGNGLTGANNLTIDNNAGVTLTSNVTVTGILDFANGLLATGANAVTIGSAGSITNATSSKYVNGRLGKTFTSATSFIYPIGTATNYRPAVFTYTAAPGTKTATIQYLEQALPFSFPANTSQAIFGNNKYWSVTQSAGGTAATVALDDDGISQTAGATVQVVRSDNGAAGTNLSASFSSPYYTSGGFTVANANANYFAIGETAIPLTITGVTAVDKVYNGNTTATLNTGSAALSGVISPDVVTLNSGSATGSFADKHIGAGKAVTVSGFTLGGANGGAYTLPSPNQVAGLTAEISVRPITVSAVTDTKTYDGTTSSAAVPAYTLQPGDATGTAPTQTFDTKHVGTNKTLTASGLVINDGNSGNNYSISYADDNTGEIQVRNITVSAVTDTKFYDGNTSSIGVPTYTLQSGDATGTAPTQTFDNANVGTGKTLTASGLAINDGNSGNNYNISYAADNTGAINQLAVTVTPDAGQFKVFGDADPTFTYTASPSLISPDIFTGALSRNAGEALGFYNYTLGTLSAGGNYSLSLGGSNQFEIQAISQANADFRSQANGNFSSASTWQYDLGGGNWQNATQPPSSSNNVSITHDVVLDQDFTVGVSKSFALGTGGTFVVNPTRTFSVATSGTADFSGKAVTFQSDNTGTASLGQVLGTVTGATNVTVERYIPNNGFRSWRLLSVPTFGNGQTIRQAWQEGNANPLPMQNNLANRGTQITGVFTTQAAAAAAGFDSTSVQAGMLTWGGTAWNNVTTTNTPIANNKAYFLYIRGERSKGVTGTATNSSATTLRTNGTIYTGDQVNNISANSFAVVPNLYPSAIDFTGLTRTGGVSNLFYVWDSKKQNGSSLGIYQTFSGTNGFNCMISGGSYVLGQPNTTIESGQAFFVQSTAAGSITLKETAKVSGTNGSLGFRPLTPASSLVKIDTRLYGAGVNNMLDANVVVFDAAYSNAVDGDDAVKFTNPGENIGIQKGSVVLAIEGRQPVVTNDVIQYKIWNLQQQTYTMEIVAANMATQGVSAVLEDSYLQTSTPLDLTGTTTVSFSVNANSASSAAARFRIVFRQLAPVPVNFVSITGYRTNEGVKVDWKSASERGIKEYVIERSTDGINFTEIGNKVPESNNAIEISYSFTDATAPSTALMYRIKSQGVNNEIRYSPVAKVSALNVKAGFAISPNPVENGIVNLQFNVQQAGKYSIRIISTEGRTIMIKNITHAGGSSVQNITLPQTTARGTYNVEITAPDNTKTVQTLFVNSK